MSASAIFSFGYPSPTPLSPRSHNTPTRSYDFFAKASPTSSCVARSLFSMPPTPPITPPSDLSKLESRSDRCSRRSSPALTGQPVAQRRPAQNPMARTSTQKQQQKRDEFLEGVKSRRDEQMFDERGDKLLQLDYINERQAWLHWNQTQHIPEPTLETEDEEMAGSSQSFQHTASCPGDSNTTINHMARPQQQTYLGSVRTHHPGLSHPNMTIKRQPDEHSQYDPALDDILEAESRELEALVQMHEEVASSAMEQDVPMWQHTADAALHSGHEDVPIRASSPTFWGSEDGDDSFEGELWRLVDGGEDEEMDLS